MKRKSFAAAASAAVMLLTVSAFAQTDHMEQTFSVPGGYGTEVFTTITAYDENNSAVWSVQSPTVNNTVQVSKFSDFAESSDRVYLSVDSILYCYDRETGELCWTAEDAGNFLFLNPSGQCFSVRYLSGIIRGFDENGSCFFNSLEEIPDLLTFSWPYKMDFYTDEIVRIWFEAEFVIDQEEADRIGHPFQEDYKNGWYVDLNIRTGEFYQEITEDMLHSGETEETTAYEEVLEQYRYVLYEGPAAGNEEWVETLEDRDGIVYVNEMFVRNRLDSSEYFYSYYDIDRNGIDELLIGFGSGEASSTDIIDLYGLDRESGSVQALAGDITLGYRNQVTLLSDGSLFFTGADSAFSGYYSLEKLAEDGYHLEKVDSFVYDYREHPEDPLYNEALDLRLTEEEYELRKEGYPAAADDVTWIPFDADQTEAETSTLITESELEPGVPEFTPESGAPETVPETAEAESAAPAELHVYNENADYLIVLWREGQAVSFERDCYYVTRSSGCYLLTDASTGTILGGLPYTTAPDVLFTILQNYAPALEKSASDVNALLIWNSPYGYCAVKTSYAEYLAGAERKYILNSQTVEDIAAQMGITWLVPESLREN